MGVSRISCHSPKIIPLVYDESLSYYEAICKLQEKINEIIDVINRLESESNGNTSN